MAIVQSFGALQAMTDPAPTWYGSSSGSLNLYGLSQTYADLYRTQPNIRICVDFLARNIAQLGLPVYRRISDTDRERLADHDLSRWLAKPNPSTTRYRLIEDLMTDLGIYFRAYWLKVRPPDAPNDIGLVRLPPDEVTVEGTLLPTEFIWTVQGREKKFQPSEIVHFSGYRLGISPLETLRRILAEESAAGAYREAFWTSGARFEGVIERPTAAPKWSPAQMASWREQWQAAFGAGGTHAGAVAVLDDGMSYRPTSFSAKDSEYTQGGQLRREVVAAAYHIPQPLVGILTHATFSNIRAQHEHLYQDCLGPWNEMITQEIERQLLPECKDQARVYIEFNIDAKLAGTPQDRAASLHLAVGRPWTTVNEARALENRPRIDDPELDTVAPQQGGPAASVDRPAEPSDEERAESVATVIQAAQARQRVKLAKVDESERAVAFAADFPRWTRELTADLTPILGEDEAQRVAAGVNAQTYQQLAEALYV